MPSLTFESREDELLGYEFVDKETKMQLELMDDLQKLGISKYLDLPQVGHSPTILFSYILTI